MFNLGQAVGQLVLDARGVVAGVNQGIAAIRRLPGATGPMFKGMEKQYKDNFFALQDLATGFNVVAEAAATGFGLAAKAAIEWESAMAGIERTAGQFDNGILQNADALEKLEDQLFSMASRKPIATTDLAAIAEEAGALGLRADDIAGFTSVIADMEAATNVTGEVATSALARIGNIMGVTTADYERMGSATVELGRSTAATEGEILTMAKRVAGAGRQVGLSTDQVLAFSAAMASVGIREEQGGSGISRTFIDIQNAVSAGGDELELFAAVSGQSVDEFIEKWGTDAGAATVGFVAGLRSIADQGGDVFAVLNDLGITEQRQRDVLLRLTGDVDGLAKAMDIGSDAYAKNVALSDVANARYNTTGAQLSMLRNQFFQLGTQVGNDLLPVLKILVGIVSTFAAGLTSLPAPVRVVLAIMVALGAAIAGTTAALGFFIPRVQAGFAALEALAVSSTTATFAINGLKTALGVIGAILAVASAAITIFGIVQQEAAEDADKLAQAQQAVASSVQALRQGNDNAIKGWILQSSAVSGFKDELVAAGITMDQIMATALQQIPPGQIFGQLNAAVQAYRAELIAGGVEPDQAIERSRNKFKDLRRAIADTIDPIITEKARQDELNDSLEEAGVVTDEYIANMEQLKEQREKDIEAIEKQNQAQLDLLGALRSQRSAYAGLDDAQRRFAEAQDKLANLGNTIQSAEDRVTSSLLAEEEASQKLADAQQTLADARRLAAQELREAELDLADAEADRDDTARKIIELQEDLQEATLGPTLKEQTEAAKNLNKALLDLRHAEQTLQDAQWQLNYLMEEGASNRDISDAQLDLADAYQDRADAIDELSDAEEDLHDLNDPVKQLEKRREAERKLEQTLRDQERAIFDVGAAQAALDQKRAEVAADTAYRDAQRAVQEAEIAIRDAQANTREELDALHELQNGEVERQFQQAQLDLEDAYYRVAEANVEVMRQQALARGETWETWQTVQALRDQLIALSGDARWVSGDVSANLDAMGSSLIANTPPRHIEITADGGQAIGVAENVGDTFERTADDASRHWYDVFGDVWNWLDESVRSLHEDFMGLFAGEAPGWGNIGGGADTPWVPWAKGGLVTRAHLGLVGEAGPELILPLRDMKRTFDLLQESGLMSMIMSRYLAGQNGGASALEQFSLAQSIKEIDQRAGFTMPDDLGGMIGSTNNDTTNLKVMSQANPARIAREIAWKRRVRRR